MAMQMKHFLIRTLNQCGFFFGGDQPPVSYLEKLRSVVGVFIGLLIVIGTAKYFGEWVGINEWLMASLGASAFLVFVLPGSPMAQPWAVIAGNTISALVGITCVHLVGGNLLAIPFAAAVSILAMFTLRCLHPPAAAVALIVVLGHIGHYRYAFFPVMIDSILLILVGVAYNSLTGKPYPNKAPN